MSSAKHDCAKSDKGPPCCAYDTQSRRQTCSYTAVTEQPIETPFQPTALRRFIDEFSVADRVWAVASNFHFAITEVRLPLRHGRIWRGREILAPEFLKRLFWSPNPLPSFHRSSYCVPSFNLSIATQEDDPPCRPSAQARASKLMMKMCQQRALSRQILLLQYIS